MADERLLTTAEVARHLGVSTTRIRGWIRSGRLPEVDMVRTGSRLQRAFPLDWLAEAERVLSKQRFAPDADPAESGRREGQKEPLRPDEVERAVQGVEPRSIRKWYAIIDGRRYPTSQVFELIAREGVSSEQQRRVLAELGFQIGSLGGDGPELGAPLRLESIPVVHVSEGWRFHRREFDPVFFFRGPTAYAPTGAPELGVVYFADATTTAVAEVASGADSIRMSDFEGFVLSLVRWERPKRLADMRSPEARMSGFDIAVARSADYEVTQQWASWIADAGFDGLLLPSRAEYGPMYAIFGPEGEASDGETLVQLRLRESDFLRAGISVVSK